MSAKRPEMTSEIQEQANHLRRELKEWERSYAAANQGRKAGRDDIKAHPIIASKYKNYTKLRDLLSGHSAPTSHSSSPHTQQPSRKRKHSTHPPSADNPHPHQTPRKQPRHSTSTSTPLKHQHPSQLDPYDCPSAIRKLLLTHTPRPLRTSIGPTPQRDGHVLGLFDAFPDAAPSPLKFRTALGSIPGNKHPHNNATSTTKGTATAKANGNAPLTTPSKNSAKKGVVDDDGDDLGAPTPTSEVARKHSRTPTSTGKRFLLDSYATPTARRIVLHPDGHNRTTDSATSLHFSTPAFLRRDSRRAGDLADGDADGDGDGEGGLTSPGMGFGGGRGRGMRGPLDLRAPVRGGLSGILAGLRKMEEERLDGEMDVLRELERENEDVDVVGDLGTEEGGVLVRDSQAGPGPGPGSGTGMAGTEMRLGVDRGSSSDFDSDSDSNPQSKANKGPTRTYKKKGQKRTTRRVVMKPQPLRPSGHAPLLTALVPADATTTTTTSADADGGETTTTTRIEDGGGGGGGAGDGTTGKKGSRKTISASAHANYRTLKIRGKGAKGTGKGSGHGRRFGGRR